MRNIITRKEIIHLLFQDWDKNDIKDVKRYYMNIDDMTFIKDCQSQHINLQLIRKNTYYLI